MAWKAPNGEPRGINWEFAQLSGGLVRPDYLVRRHLHERLCGGTLGLRADRPGDHPTLLIAVGTLAGMTASLVAGALVDRLNRKLLIALGDTVAAAVTLIILVLLVRDGLAIWHLYLAQMVRAIFGDVQDLAFSASTALMVPERYYGRVGSLGSRFCCKLMGWPGKVRDDLS
jgi:MFS family permease